MKINWKQVKELKAAIGPLYGRSLQYCSDACLKRYLEARNWNVDKAKKMLEETLKWRSTYRPEEIRWVSWFQLSCVVTFIQAINNKSGLGNIINCFFEVD